MTLSFIRSFFLIIFGVVGYYVGALLQAPIFGAQIGFLSGLLLIFIEMKLQRVSVRGLSSMVFGLLLGVLLAKLLSRILMLLPLSIFVQSISEIVLTVVFSYLGAVMALRGKDEFNIIIPYVRFKRQDVGEAIVLLDTSVIIDGRIVDIYKTRFLSGRLVVPRCVLQELQALADSADDIKRQRGRRGLELLQSMQNDPKMDIRVHEDDLRGAESVDSKLMNLAKAMDAKICTTDFNLSQTASLQGIEMLNLNELVNAIKTLISAGDQMEIKLLKEGKESGQAIGYLDDGTMVVVSDGRNQIGEKVNVMVTSVLQTQAGKMIFAKVQR